MHRGHHRRSRARNRAGAQLGKHLDRARVILLRLDGADGPDENVFSNAQLRAHGGPALGIEGRGSTRGRWRSVTIGILQPLDARLARTESAHAMTSGTFLAPRGGVIAPTCGALWMVGTVRHTTRP